MLYFIKSGDFWTCTLLQIMDVSVNIINTYKWTQSLMISCERKCGTMRRAICIKNTPSFVSLFAACGKPLSLADVDYTKCICRETIIYYWHNYWGNTSRCDVMRPSTNHLEYSNKVLMGNQHYFCHYRNILGKYIEK